MEVCQLVDDQTKAPVLDRYRFAGTVLALILVNASISRVTHAQETEEPHTEAAVIADDKGWNKAEDQGDAAFIDQLLMPEYRSISSDGNVHAIIASARNVNSPERKAGHGEVACCSPLAYLGCDHGRHRDFVLHPESSGFAGPDHVERYLPLP